MINLVYLFVVAAISVSAVQAEETAMPVSENVQNIVQPEPKSEPPAVSTDTSKNVTIQVEKAKDSEPLKLDVDMPKKQVIDEVFRSQSAPDSPFLHFDRLHKAHGGYPEKSSVRMDLLEPSSFDEPPENYIYSFHVEFPGQYKGWELKVVSSRGEILWNLVSEAEPPKEIIWNGRNEHNEWKVMIGEQYSFIFKGFNKETKKNEYWEKSFKAGSYIYETEKGTSIRVSVDSIFDERGLELTQRGKKILKKVFYKIKSVKSKGGFFDIRSSRPETAKAQLDIVLAYAKENLVDLGGLIVSTLDVQESADYFDIMLSKKPKK